MDAEVCSCGHRFEWQVGPARPAWIPPKEILVVLGALSILIFCLFVRVPGSSPSGEPTGSPQKINLVNSIGFGMPHREVDRIVGTKGVSLGPTTNARHNLDVQDAIFKYTLTDGERLFVPFNYSAGDVVSGRSW